MNFPLQAYILDEFDDLFITQLGELTVSPEGCYTIDDPAKISMNNFSFGRCDMNNTYHVSIEVLDMDEKSAFS